MIIQKVMYGNTQQPEVCVLLATYNGESFIKEQIQSICNQNFENWTLLIRDDGSTDATKAICEKLASNDSRIDLLNSSNSNQGPCRNFEHLVSAGLNTSAQFFAFADQDDYWESDKLSQHVFHAGKYCSDIPYLSYSDSKVINDNNETIAESFMRFQGLNHSEPNTLLKLLMQNSVVGASMFANRRLLQVAIPFPKVYMHDWWLAVIAKSYSQLVFIPAPLMSYRLHNDNTCGAIGAGSALNTIKNISILRINKMIKLFLMTFEQATALSERIDSLHPDTEDTISKLTRREVDTYLNIRHGNRFGRVRKFLALSDKHDHIIARLFWVTCLIVMENRNPVTRG